jgi:hypothetical protein
MRIDSYSIIKALRVPVNYSVLCPMQDYPLAPLEDDCKLLRNLLDDCLRIEVGENLFSKVREIVTLKVSKCYKGECEPRLESLSGISARMS